MRIDTNEFNAETDYFKTKEIDNNLNESLK
jgi:hypothetical protein